MNSPGLLKQTESRLEYESMQLNNIDRIAREKITGTEYWQITQRDENGVLLSVSIDNHTYIHQQYGELIFDHGFVTMRNTLSALGLLRTVKTPYASWQELFKLDEKRQPVNIDGMRIKRDSKGRVINVTGHEQEWTYHFYQQHLVGIDGPFGQRQILRDDSGRPTQYKQAHYSKPISYDEQARRLDLPELPENFCFDEEGRLRAILSDDGTAKYIYLWDGYNCLARLDGKPGSPLSYVYSLDLTGTPVRLISRDRQTVVPRDAYGENLLPYTGHPGLFGGANYAGYVWLRSRVLDGRCASFNMPDPLHGGEDDPRRLQGFQGGLFVETQKAGAYAVCQYDPMTYLDPTGEIAWYYVISTLTWAFPNNILSWIGLEATANFWGTFFTASWSDWADAEHWTSNRLDIGGVQRQAFFKPGNGAFTTQHIIWAQHAYIDGKRRSAVFDPGGSYQPRLYGSMLRVVPSIGPPFLLNGQMTIGGITQPRAQLWVRGGGPAVAVAPGQRLPIFPEGGLHFQLRGVDTPGPQPATITELTATGSVGIGTLNNNTSLSATSAGLTLSQGDLVLLTDGATAVDIISVVTAIPDGAQQTVRLGAAPVFTATTGITLRQLAGLAWTETLQNNGMPATNYLDAITTANAYQINDALQLDDGTNQFDAQIIAFETRVTVDAALDGGPTPPLTIFAVTVDNSNTFNADITGATQLDFGSGPVPSAGDFIIITEGATSLAVIVGAGSGSVRSVDRDLGGFTGPAIDWNTAMRGTDLGTQSVAMVTGQLSYAPAALNVFPAAGDHIGVEFGPAGAVVRQLRTITSLDHHALVLNTSSPLTAAASFTVNRYPVGNPFNNLSLSQTLILALTQGNVSNAVALQVYQFGGTNAVGTTLMEGNLELAGNTASRQMTTSSAGTLTPNQPVTLRPAGAAGGDEALVTQRVARDIFLGFDFTSTNASLEIVLMATTGFAYDALVSGAAQVVVSPVVSSAAAPIQADMPSFFTGEAVELVDSATSNIIGQYRITGVPEGTVLDLSNGPALPAVGTAITLQRISVIPSGNGVSRIAINGQTDFPGAGGVSHVIRADVWNRDTFAVGSYIGVIDGNQTFPFVIQTGYEIPAAPPATNQIDLTGATLAGVVVATPGFAVNTVVQLAWQDSAAAARSQEFEITGITGTLLTLTPGGALSITPADTDIVLSRIPRVWVDFTTTPTTTGPVDLYDINPANTQFFAEFTRETDETVLMPNTGTLASPSPNAVMVVPLAATGTAQNGTLSSGTARVPEDPENTQNGEHDRHQQLVEHELRHTEQYLWWGPMFITLIPFWPVELALELSTDIEQPDYGPFQQATLVVPDSSTDASDALKITFEGGGDGGFSVNDLVQINQGVNNVDSRLAAPVDGEGGFRIERARELRAGTIYVREKSLPAWAEVLGGIGTTWFRTLSIGGLTQLAASLTHGTFFQIAGRFFYMIYRAIQMACCDDRQDGEVQGDRRQVRLADPSKRGILENVDRLLVQEPQSFGNAVFSGIDTVVRSRDGEISEDGVISLSAPLSWADGTAVSIGPYQSRTPGQLLDWKKYYPATIQTDNRNVIQIHPIGSDTLSLQPFDRLRCIAESEHFGMFNANRTVMAVTGDRVELNQQVPGSGTPDTELSVRVAKIGTADPYDFLDSYGTEEIFGSGWLRWATDPFGQLYWETRPEPGGFWDILGRIGKYIMGTKAWSNPVIITSRYFMEAMTKSLHNVSLEQDASEQSGNLYTPIGRIRGEANVNSTNVTMTVGDIGRFWYFADETTGTQTSLPPVNAGIGTNDPGLRMDDPGNSLIRDQIVFPQQTAETPGAAGVGAVNIGAQAAALAASPGLDMADVFWQKQSGDPNEVSRTVGVRRMLASDLGVIPLTPQLQLSSAVYLAFTRATPAGATHRATMDDGIFNATQGRDAQNNGEQRLFYNITVQDVTVNINGLAVADGGTVNLLRTQNANITVSDEGAKQYAVLVMQPNNGTAVQAAFTPNKTIAAQDPFAGGTGPFSEPMQICRWHDFDPGSSQYRSGGLAQHGMHLPVDIFIPVRKLTVNVLELPPVLTALPPTLDFTMYPAAGTPLPSIQPGASLFFPVAANVPTATQALAYATPPSPDITVVPDRSFQDISSTASQQVQDFLGDGLLYSLSLGEDDVPEEQSNIAVIFNVGDTALAATITMTIPVDGHFLARGAAALAASGYQIAVGGSDVLECFELGGANVTPDSTSVTFTLRDGSPVPQITSGGSLSDELTFSDTGNQLTINVDAAANTTLDGGFRRLLITDAGGTQRASRTIQMV